MMAALIVKNDKADVVEDGAEVFLKGEIIVYRGTDGVREIIVSRGTDGVRLNLLLITKVV